MKRIHFIAPLLASSAALQGQQPITITSDAFKNNNEIPLAFVHIHCGGKNEIPTIHWSQPPSTAKTLVLMMEDPNGHDEQGNPWIHWLIFNIPATLTGIDAATDLTGLSAVQGRNSWGKNSYGGPCPPVGSGVHNYQFKLYALDNKLNIDSTATAEHVRDAMQDHVVATGVLIGRYERK
jgi:Raf kinase inhibitor-like YbhB/YbcL family protein